MKVYDLTHTISKDMTVYSKSTKPDIKKVATIDINGYQESLISIYSHNGTHIDAPKHMCNGKWLYELEMSNFIGNAILIDIENKKIVENLTNLDKISGRFLFSAIPLKYNDSDGSPTRAIAIIN